MAKKKTAPAKGKRLKTTAKAATRKKQPAAKPRKTPKRAVVAPAPKQAAKPVALGRPRIPADAPLYLLFKEDFQARQVFAFLGAETVGQLEAHGPKEILKTLTVPLTQTVERIRRKLAENNRCLAGDEAYLLEAKTDAAKPVP